MTEDNFIQQANLRDSQIVYQIAYLMQTGAISRQERDWFQLNVASRRRTPQAAMLAISFNHPEWLGLANGIPTQPIIITEPPVVPNASLNEADEPWLNEINLWDVERLDTPADQALEEPPFNDKEIERLEAETDAAIKRRLAEQQGDDGEDSD